MSQDNQTFSFVEIIDFFDDNSLKSVTIKF